MTCAVYVIDGSLLLSGLIYFGGWSANINGNVEINGVIVLDQSSNTLLNASGCITGNITVQANVDVSTVNQGLLSILCEWL